MVMFNKVLVLGSWQYSVPFVEHSDNIINKAAKAVTVDDIVGTDLIVFCGGTDVDPKLYGEPRHYTTGGPDEVRDAAETRVFEIARKNGIKMAGICRGSQFLTVMNGGKLVQDINGHAIVGVHEINYIPSFGGGIKQAKITSTHHQMMWPILSNNQHIVIAWDDYEPEISDINAWPKGTPMVNGQLHTVIEGVWWPDSKCLCVQGHPEYMAKDSSGWKFYQDLIKGYLV